jgi:hypothetical protein
MPGNQTNVPGVPYRSWLYSCRTALRPAVPKLIRVARGLVALCAALIVLALLAGYFVYYRGKLGRAETEAALRTDAMRRVQCVRGWQRLSTWTYVCTIQWRDGKRVSGDVEVDAHRVTNDGMLP